MDWLERIEMMVVLSLKFDIVSVNELDGSMLNDIDICLLA